MVIVPFCSVRVLPQPALCMTPAPPPEPPELPPDPEPLAPLDPPPLPAEPLVPLPAVPPRPEEPLVPLPAVPPRPAEPLVPLPAVPPRPAVELPPEPEPDVGPPVPPVLPPTPPVPVAPPFPPPPPVLTAPPVALPPSPDPGCDALDEHPAVQVSHSRVKAHGARARRKGRDESVMAGPVGAQVSKWRTYVRLPKRPRCCQDSWSRLGIGPPPARTRERSATLEGFAASSKCGRVWRVGCKRAGGAGCRGS